MTGARRAGRVLAAAALAGLVAVPARSQTVNQRGSVETSAFWFPQDASNDSTNVVGDLLGREEAFVKPAPWLQFAGGVDFRANTHGQVQPSWRVNFSDRGALRPRVSVRRLGATMAHGPLTLDVGKQFIRWGTTDIVTPTDRFAPRDFVNVVDSEFLAVSGVRAVWQAKSNALDAVWVPWLTPSRTPLLNQRWTAVPSGAGVLLVDGGASIPQGSEWGLHWAHTGRGYEYSLSWFDGFNHLPNISARPVTGLAGELLAEAIVKQYPTLRMYGADAAVPTEWFTVKGETAYFTTSTPATDEYVLYVVQLERQTGEWLLVGGYAGEAVTRAGGAPVFAPDRGMARSIVGRASYTLDSNRSAALEAAVHQDGRGVYAKGEYSEARGQHWRATLAAVLIRGDEDDFFGQYRLNSHMTLTLRYSF